MTIEKEPEKSFIKKFANSRWFDVFLISMVVFSLSVIIRGEFHNSKQSELLDLYSIELMNSGKITEEQYRNFHMLLLDHDTRYDMTDMMIDWWADKTLTHDHVEFLILTDWETILKEDL